MILKRRQTRGALREKSGNANLFPPELHDQSARIHEAGLKTLHPKNELPGSSGRAEPPNELPGSPGRETQRRHELEAHTWQGR